MFSPSSRWVRQDLLSGEIKKGMAGIILAVIPGGVQMVVASIDRDHIPHMGHILVVKAPHQGGLHPRLVQQKLHGAGIALAYRLPLHQRAVSGKSVGKELRRIIAGGGVFIIGADLQKLVVKIQLGGEFPCVRTAVDQPVHHPFQLVLRLAPAPGSSW